MKAWVLSKLSPPLEIKEVPLPQLGDDELLIQVSCCALCRTDLHILDGELPSPKLPLILGHQIVGNVVEKGKNVQNIQLGERVGVPWLAKTCRKCSYCKEGRENLCDQALYTGYTVDGGLAQYCASAAQFCFPLPPGFTDVEAAPLLCAGMIGWRALRLTQGAKKIGFYGFGAAAQLLIQVVNHQGGSVYAFTRKGAALALQLGACFAADFDQLPPTPLDAAIIFAPLGELYPQALRAVKKGGIVVSAGIHMSEIPAFSYDLLWNERVMRSVSNLTRQDGEELLRLAPEIPIKTQVATYPFEALEHALQDHREGIIPGTKVVII